MVAALKASTASRSVASHCARRDGRERQRESEKIIRLMRACVFIPRTLIAHIQTDNAKPPRNVNKRLQCSATAISKWLLHHQTVFACACCDITPRSHVPLRCASRHCRPSLRKDEQRRWLYSAVTALSLQPYASRRPPICFGEPTIRHP